MLRCVGNICVLKHKLLYTSRVNYYNDKITEGGHNTKTLFKIAKELIGHNEIYQRVQSNRVQSHEVM